MIEINNKAVLFAYDSMSFFLISLFLILFFLIFFSSQSSAFLEQYKKTNLRSFALDYSESLVSLCFAKKDFDKKRVLENIFQDNDFPKEFPSYFIAEISLPNKIIYSNPKTSKNCLSVQRLVLYKQKPEHLKIKVCEK